MNPSHNNAFTALVMLGMVPDMGLVTDKITKLAQTRCL